MPTLRGAARRVNAGLRNGYMTPGICPVCGHFTVFALVVPHQPTEGYQCARCRCPGRCRIVALELTEHLGGRSLPEAARRGLSKEVYVVSGDGWVVEGLGGPSTTGLTTSAFHPDQPWGSALGGGPTTNQNLEHLTYPDESFDIIVTEEVLEHVRDPDACFREIHRVLKSGGCHVFTIPMKFDAPLLTRVDTAGAQDVCLMEEEWHGDPILGRILSYRRFGYDLFDQLRRHGYETRLRLPSIRDRRAGVYDCYALISTKLAVEA